MYPRHLGENSGTSDCVLVNFRVQRCTSECARIILVRIWAHLTVSASILGSSRAHPEVPASLGRKYGYIRLCCVECVKIRSHPVGLSSLLSSSRAHPTVLVRPAS